MKKTILFLLVLFTSMGMFAQWDDVYYTPNKSNNIDISNTSYSDMNYEGYYESKIRKSRSNGASIDYDGGIILNILDLPNGVYDVQADQYRIYFLSGDFSDNDGLKNDGITNIYDLEEGYYTIYVEDNQIIIKRDKLLELGRNYDYSDFANYRSIWMYGGYGFYGPHMYSIVYSNHVYHWGIPYYFNGYNNFYVDYIGGYYSYYNPYYGGYYDPYSYNIGNYYMYNSPKNSDIRRTNNRRGSSRYFELATNGRRNKSDTRFTSSRNGSSSNDRISSSTNRREDSSLSTNRRDINNSRTSTTRRNDAYSRSSSTRNNSSRSTVDSSRRSSSSSRSSIGSSRSTTTRSSGTSTRSSGSTSNRRR